MTSPVGRVVRGLLLVGLVLAMALAGFTVLAVAGLETGPAAFGLAVVLAFAPDPPPSSAVQAMLTLVLFHPAALGAGSRAALTVGPALSRM